MISKTELLEMLWSVVNDSPEAFRLRESAAKSKDKYWNPDEWIYVKDIEVCLKMLRKDLVKKGFNPIQSITDLIFRGVGEEQFLQSSWAMEKIGECRANLKSISNPE